MFYPDYVLNIFKLKENQHQVLPDIVAKLFLVTVKNQKAIATELFFKTS